MPVAQARRATRRRPRSSRAPDAAVAEVRDVEVPGPGGADPGPRLPARRRAPPPAVAYFHGGGWVVGLAGLGRRGLPRARQRRRRPGGERRLPPRAGAPLPGGARRLPGRDALAGRARRRARGRRRAPRRGGRQRRRQPGDGGRRARLRDEGGPPLRFQALVYPVTDAALATPSYREFDEGYGLTTLGMRRYWDLYLDGASGAEPDASPLRATDLAGLPPALVLTADADVLRDDGEAYADALRRAPACRSTQRRYDGAIHGFWRWLGAAELSAPRRAEVGAALRAALG